MRTLIIDDEENSHVILEYLIGQKHPEIDVVGHAHSVPSGIESIKNLKPDLIFLDIELPPFKGFDLLRAVAPCDFKVIFITGQKDNDYAIQAFRYGGMDFLLKPIDSEELAEAIQRCADYNYTPNLEQLTYTEKTTKILHQRELPSRITIPTVDEIYFRKLDDIIRLEADKNYTTFFFTNSQEPLVASKNLGSYESALSGLPHFFRIHKSHIVNLNFADKYKKGEASLVTIDGAELPVSKRKREDLLERISKPYTQTN